MVRKGKDGALHLRQIRHYMETGAYLSSVHLSEKNGIRKSAKKFLIEGRTKTLRRLTERYYWTSMVEDIVAMIVRCKTCEFNKLNRPNQRYVRVTEPWELNSRLELDTGLVGNVVAVNKTQVNRPDEASIKTAILRHCHESGNIWDDLLQRKVYEMNTTHITASGQTPFYLMFHRQVRPMDTNFCLQMSGNGKPTFVVRDIERYMEEREQRANDIINQVLNGQPSQSTIKTSPEDTSNDCVENIPTTTFIDAVQDGNHEYQTSVQVVTDAPGPDQDHAHYTHVAHLSDGQVIQDPGGSVYDMGDGEGHVVVVADGMTGLEEGGEVAGQHMVVVQPGVDQGVIMLSESQVIMEAVDGQQFTYMSQT
ncbi:Gypsy retrotransposon integrase-like protein 1-like 1 [Homarus americanus]|uniref:Gypsy retrotransposon integrase-like protein 1-like 1 n=1 Tax=Homarus americanus TaxID=6706 RepID=A0A8J5K5W6_HOMAM|nr:Gypsy retrotransposon integrase-like protein 1-like 1 [Homarus americanus]